MAHQLTMFFKDLFKFLSRKKIGWWWMNFMNHKWKWMFINEFYNDQQIKVIKTLFSFRVNCENPNIYLMIYVGVSYKMSSMTTCNWLLTFINITIEYFHHRLEQTKIKHMDKSNEMSIIVSQNKRNVNIDLKVENYKTPEWFD